MSKPEDVQARLEALRRQYVGELPGRIADLEREWSRLDAGAWSAPAFQAFHRGIHALAGSGAMFGFEALSMSARTLDHLLKTLGTGVARPDREIVLRISGGLADLRRAAGIPGETR